MSRMDEHFMEQQQQERDDNSRWQQEQDEHHAWLDALDAERMNDLQRGFHAEQRFFNIN